MRGFSGCRAGFVLKNNKYIMSLIEENNQVIISIMFPVLYLYGDAIQHQEHGGNENLIVLLNEPQNVLVIPETQSLLHNLKKTRNEKTEKNDFIFNLFFNLFVLFFRLQSGLCISGITSTLCRS